MKFPDLAMIFLYFCVTFFNCSFDSNDFALCYKVYEISPSDMPLNSSIRFAFLWSSVPPSLLLAPLLYYCFSVPDCEKVYKILKHNNTRKWARKNFLQ